MSNKVIILIATALLLAACGTVPQRKAEAPPAPPAPKAGGYLEGDGPGSNPPANIDAIPDAVPKYEPLHRYANRPYIALGKTYVPLTVTGDFKQRGIASWYGRKFNGERTSSGEIYDMYAMTAAHPTLPLPSYARVTNLANHKSVIVRINDRGPFMNDRIIDLSYTAAHKLGIIGDGSAEVEVDSISPDTIINTIPVITVESKPLESSTPAIPAITPVAAASAVVAAPAAASSVPAAPVSTAPAPVAVPPAAAPAVVAAAPANNNSGVYLQLGAFSTQAGAEAYLDKMRAELGSTGKEIKLVSKDGLVRVHIGPYASQSEARSSAESMQGKLGFKPMVNLP
ncbi:MAG: septal ring lytic transglycosylase RlpA family protein [Gallionella sp.]